MVMEKRKSGDPDFDDKQPVEVHAGRVVQGPDGRDVVINPATGPVDAYTGVHVSLDGPTAEDLDNRPEPGGQAEKPSEVQTFEVKGSPLEKAMKAAESRLDAEDENADNSAAGGQSGDQQAAETLQETQARTAPAAAKPARRGSK